MTLRLEARFTADASSMSRAAREAGREIDRLGRETRGAGRAARGAAGDVDRLERETGQAARATRGLAGEQDRLGSTLRSVRGLIAGLGIGLLAREAFTAGLAYRSAQALFRTAAGDAAAGARELARAGEFAERLGLGLEAAEQGYGKLLAAARGTALADDAAAIFEGVATAAAALQLPTEQVAGALTAVEQIISKGKVSAEELRGQLGERIPGAFQIAARAAGVTVAELDKMLETGELLAEDFLPAFARQLKDEFGDAAEDAARGATAEFNRFGNAVTDAFRAFTESGFLDEVTRALGGLAAELRDPETQEALRAFGQGLGDGIAFAARNAETLKLVLGGLVALKASAAIGGLFAEGAAGATALSGAAALLTGRLSATAAAAALLRGALSFLGGPVGLAVTALIGGIAVLNSRTGESAAALARADGAARDMREALDLAEQATRDMASAGDDSLPGLEKRRDALLAQAEAARQVAEAEIRAALAIAQNDLALARNRLDAVRPLDRDEAPARLRESLEDAEQGVVDALKAMEPLTASLRALEAGRAGDLPPGKPGDGKPPPRTPPRGSKAKTPDVLGEIETETAALIRMAAARAAGAEAIRDELILREQVAALGRAGLELADLEGGANQARARAIAEAVRALHDETAAAEAVDEVTRAYGRTVGTTYDEAAREVLAWREAVLRDLAGVGAGHEALAAKVEDVVRVRLAEAWEEDLDRRADWQAGLERGLREVAGAHVTMAERAEEAVKTAFKGIEDAFVSLATTGKIETSDLVDYVLRELFRLASQSAFDLGGGGGGGILGQIFGSVLGGLFGGGGSSSTGIFGPGEIGGAGIYHEGGRVGPGGPTRLVAGALFAAAPRLHGGGLLPGERPAILLEDERVLTAAQSEAVAQTVSGLARLAAAPAREPEPRVVINIVGGRDEPSRIAQRREGDATIVDVIYEQLDARLATETAAGRSLTGQAVARRFQLRPGGSF